MSSAVVDDIPHLLGDDSCPSQERYAKVMVSSFLLSAVMYVILAVVLSQEQSSTNQGMSFLPDYMQVLELTLNTTGNTAPPELVSPLIWPP